MTDTAIDAGDVAAFEAAVANALSRVPEPDRLLLKVNLCAAPRYPVDAAVWVPPELVSRVIEAIRRVWPDTELLIGESDSVGGVSSREKFQAANYDVLTALPNVSLVNLEEQPTTSLRVGPRTASLPKLLDELSVVSITKAKTHNIAGFTGATKNLFGLFVGDKSLLHPFLRQALTTVTDRADCILSVADASPAHVGDGPCRGSALDLGCIYVGADPVRLDGNIAAAWDIPRVILPRTSSSADQGDLALPAVPSITVSPREQTNYVRLGLGLQRLAGYVDRIGHEVHNARTWRDIRKAPRTLGKTLRP